MQLPHQLQRLVQIVNERVGQAEDLRKRAERSENRFRNSLGTVLILPMPASRLTPTHFSGVKKEEQKQHSRTEPQDFCLYLSSHGLRSLQAKQKARQALKKGTKSGQPEEQKDPRSCKQSW